MFANLIARIPAALAALCAASLVANPVQAATQTLHLHLKIMTGDAGLHENSRLDAIVRLSNRKTQPFTLHAPHTPGWEPHTTVQRDLEIKGQPRGVTIVGVMLEYHHGEGSSENHPWNMQGISMWAREGHARKGIEDIRGPGDYNCIMRFTGGSGASTYFIPL